MQRSAAPRLQATTGGIGTWATAACQGNVCRCRSTVSTQRVALSYTSSSYTTSAAGPANAAVSSAPLAAHYAAQQQRPRYRRSFAASAAQPSSGSSCCQLVNSTWTSPDGTVFQVLEMPAQPTSISGRSTNCPQPPVVLVHGLFRAAWYWQDSLMPALAAAGHDSFALSLRGQGSSQLCASQQPAAAAADDAQELGSQHSSSSSSSSSSSKVFAHGVPLALNVADIAAFIRSRNFSRPPVLVGHSLGGMFVQEYLHQLHRQQQQQQQQQQQSHVPHPLKAAIKANAFSSSSSSGGAALPHLSEPVPALSGAVLLASACAGTVMSFGQFIADVGLPEFLYQMYIVFSCAHLNDMNTARYCWWQDSMDEAEAAKHFEAVRSSSTALPYVTKEVGAWRPAAPGAAALRQLPPVLALGGAADRIIRPFQVAAAREYWGADVVLMDGVTHDMLLGPQASAVSEQLLAWLQQVPLASVRAARESSAGTGVETLVLPRSAAAGGGGGVSGEQLSVQFMASARRQP